MSLTLDSQNLLKFHFVIEAFKVAIIFYESRNLSLFCAKLWSFTFQSARFCAHLSSFHNVEPTQKINQFVFFLCFQCRTKKQKGLVWKDAKWMDTVDKKGMIYFVIRNRKFAFFLDLSVSLFPNVKWQLTMKENRWLDPTKKPSKNKSEKCISIELFRYIWQNTRTRYKYIFKRFSRPLLKKKDSFDNVQFVFMYEKKDRILSYISCLLTALCTVNSVSRIS